MRLRSLRLAGFKSFVHPTTLNFKQDLTAVVGPNGCGKSNVIDAIRWVMGESSARQLRGEAMSDVIFAGTVNKKPIGQASVELHFENTFGKLGGAYNAYTELSIRRQVSRDGRSDYFLNGTRCRRRDITDIFLGTGLGPRSYAVIEQGMINRLVEAKPDDLRVFLEEAAGVSRYQARRRETQQHLEDTRLNLSRLQDLADELGRRRRALERQSQAALKHKKLVEDRRVAQLELWTVQHVNAANRQAIHTTKLTQLGDDYRQLRSRLNELDHAVQQQSVRLSQLLAEAQPMQSAWQDAERVRQTAVANLTQQQQAESRLLERSSSVEAQHAALTRQIEHDQTVLAELIAVHDLSQPRRQELIQTISALEVQLPSVQEQARQTHTELQDLRTRIQSAQQKRADLEREQDHISRQHTRQAAQIAQLENALNQLDQTALADELLDIDDQLVEVTQALLRLRHEASSTQESVQTSEQSRITLRARQRELSQVFDGLRGEQRALLALQEKTDVKQVNAQKNGNKNEPQYVEPEGTRLLEQLQVSTAGQPHLALIESVLGQWLKAHVNADAPVGRNLFVSGHPLQPDIIEGTTAFSSWLTEPQSSVWQHWGVMDTRTDALARQSQLKPYQSFVTLDGHWIGADWAIDLARDAASRSGVENTGLLARRIRLETLNAELLTSEAALFEATDALKEAEQFHTQSIQAQQGLAAQINQAERSQQTIELARARLDSKLQSQQGQIEQQRQQLSLLSASQEEDMERLNDVHMEQAALELRLNPLIAQVGSREQEASAAQQNLSQTTLQIQQLRMQQQNAEMETQTRQIRIEALQTTSDRAVFQQSQLEDEQRQIQTELAQVRAEIPALTLALEAGEQEALAADQRWQARQVELKEAQAAVQQLEHDRQSQTQAENTLRDELENTRLAWQVEKSNLAQLAEQFASLEAPVPDATQLNTQTHKSEQTLHADLAQLDSAIQRLGELNLAAPAELAEVTERFDELNHQMDDLNQTLAQLDDAMQTIDRETRSLFMDTFDRVNHELQQLFPKVFGGGEARLILEDGWQSGVRFMAQPPGKRNSSIALLSGGEKALTALSLVFAIFKLNPAPFCLLDEVDAPLDDANVARFCRLVTDLSKSVQFIYITHNKLAMMMAGELMGVTMPEAGISKLVAVNLDEAETLVASTGA
ncbi:chromosome segregation protein SMC [Aquirhabdus sp.]|uniref:chromosome segregation protein SMC n=1 Tax=Aquirhabdus sp. TaxID=2824160 RepID=UPI00396CD504